MSKAGWLDVWHLVLAIIARQPPVLQIMFAMGAVFVAVMAIEGVRTSLAAIWRAHRAAPTRDPANGAPVTLAAPASRNFSAKSVSRAAVAAPRKRKPLTVGARQFRSPRPTIRRHPLPDFPSAAELPNFSADGAVLGHEGL